MRKWPRNVLATLIILVVVGGAWVVWHAPTEPVYQGKRLRVWLAGYSGTNRDRQVTDEAVRHIGTNAIPTLLKMLRAHDSPLESKLLFWATRYRALVIHYTNPSVLNDHAFMAFQALGPEAASAVPELIKILEQNVSRSSESYTARTLAVIGPGAKAAVPLLMREATSTNLTDHSDALWALGQIHADPDKAVPILISALGNPSGQDQLFAAIALGKFESDAKSAVPALLEALESVKPKSSSTAPIYNHNDFLRQSQFRLELKRRYRKSLANPLLVMSMKPRHNQIAWTSALRPPEAPF